MLNFTKLANFTIAILGIIVVALAAFIYSVKQTPPKDFTQLDKTDKLMFRSVANLYTKFAKDDPALWTSKFDLSKTPLILVRTEEKNGIKWPYAYLINFPKSDIAAIAHKVKVPAELNLSSVHAAETLGMSSLYLWSPQNYGEIKLSKNKPYFYFKYYPDQFQNNELSFNKFSSELLHHLFNKQIHGALSRDFYANEGDKVTPSSLNLDNFALQHLEYHILDKALAAKTRQSTAEHMKLWLAVRKKRYFQWQHLRWETYREAFEGTSQYINHKLKYPQTDTANLIFDENNDPINFTQKYTEIISDPINYYPARDNLAKSTGAALSIILDRLKPEWKVNFGHGQSGYITTQYGIISEIYKFSDDEQTELLKDTKHQFNYDQIFNKVMLRMTSWEH